MKSCCSDVVLVLTYFLFLLGWAHWGRAGGRIINPGEPLMSDHVTCPVSEQQEEDCLSNPPFKSLRMSGKNWTAAEQDTCSVKKKERLHCVKVTFGSQTQNKILYLFSWAHKCSDRLSVVRLDIKHRQKVFKGFFLRQRVCVVFLLCFIKQCLSISSAPSALQCALALNSDRWFTHSLRWNPLIHTDTVVESTLTEVGFGSICTLMLLHASIWSVLLQILYCYSITMQLTC